MDVLLNVQATVRDWPEPVFGKPGGGDRAEADIFKTIWYGREKNGWAYHRTPYTNDWKNYLNF